MKNHSPRPSVYFLDGLPLEDDPRHIITADRSGTCSLILDSLTAEDSGQYVCYATSSLGSAGTLAKVVVHGGSAHEHVPHLPFLLLFPLLLWFPVHFNWCLIIIIIIIQSLTFQPHPDL